MHDQPEINNMIMKIKNPNLIRNLILTIIGCSLMTACSKEPNNNWPKFLGPDSGMILSSTDLPESWNDSTTVRWTQAMDGESWSSPIISGNKVFYSSAVIVKEAPKKAEEAPAPPPPPAGGNNPQPGNGNTPPPPAPQEEDNSYKEAVYRWQLTCLDVSTGEELWKAVSYEGNPRIKKHVGSTYACETPVTDGEHVWVYYGMLGVYCYDMNGNLVWQQDPGAYPTANGWGSGSSPVLYNNTLYILVDNEEQSFLVAYDAQTGAEKWKVNRDEKTTYSTPVIWKNTQRTELVTTGSKARSYNPETGELLWELKMSGSAIPTPAVSSETIYIGNAGGPNAPGPLFAVKAGGSGDITPAPDVTTSAYVMWSDTLAGVANPSPLLYNGLLYLLASRGGEIVCLDAATGELVYKDKVAKAGACWASPWILNDKIYFYDEKGATQIIQAGPEFKVLGTNSLDDKFWASIAATEDAFIIKGVKNLFCIGK